MANLPEKSVTEKLFFFSRRGMARAVLPELRATPYTNGAPSRQRRERRIHGVACNHTLATAGIGADRRSRRLGAIRQIEIRVTGRTDRSLKQVSKFYIDGHWVDPIEPSPFTIINPATEEAVGEIALGGASDVEAAVDAAYRAFPVWSQTTAAERLPYLEKVVDGLRARIEELAEIATLTIGSPVTQARLVHGEAVIALCNGVIEALRNYEFEWLEGTTLILREPVGVCALITPWNWPLGQIVTKVLPAIAAGCTMVLKPSEHTPYDAAVFAEVIDASGLPAGVFNLVQGSGPIVGAAMASHPKVDFVSITGSTRAGAEVGRLAAPGIKRIAQELGGKSANILLADCDFAAAVPIGVYTAFRNCGQSCSAPTRMLVPEDRYEECKALAKAAAESLVVGDPSAASSTLGPLSNAAQFEKVQRLIELGLAEGAELVTGGLGRPEGIAKGYFVRPTVLGVAQSSMEIAQVEIFGPVLCMIPYRDEEEAVRIANDSAYGLGGYVQSANQSRAQAVARGIRTGTVAVNNPPLDLAAPFGGYKMSGNGRERGHFGIDDYLEVKSIVGYAQPA